ncbi:MAG TPA: altronate dehydratase family protein [Terracidiphilus sp.]|jgi:altronate hydrolase|nr:altronate dehydratase family protein [Terracidiphilus sp.]
MTDSVLQIDPRDNVVVALKPLRGGTVIRIGERTCTLTDDIPAKHKLAIVDLAPGDLIYLYGMVVGEATKVVLRGGLISTRTVRHRAADYTAQRTPVSFPLPDPGAWPTRTFNGFRRIDGQVGTRNYWIVLPLVFCENRNVDRMREALEEELGYSGALNSYRGHVRQLVKRQANGDKTRGEEFAPARAERVFPNIDGIRFLKHDGGCGGTRQDAQALCGLLAGYIHHPNVAGATVLSLGCQNAQASMLLDELRARDPGMTKPVLVFDQQKSGRESVLMTRALNETFDALGKANQIARTATPLSGLTVGLKCGGSDGLSGISANPTLGYLSDLLGELGGKTLLSEFPELHGVEQEIINRCSNDALAQRFYDLMQAYSARAKAVHSGFEMNPSPGNIEDGLTTDAIKSAGAARKGGVAPVRDVLDFPEYAKISGLSLLCTPGNDVECVTAQVGAGANLVLFTTGLGTPTGNPIAPVVKVSTNSILADRMSDIIDFDAGGIVSGDATIEECAEQLLDLCLKVASGERLTKAEQLAQNDFIPWKRGVSL